MIRAQIAIDVRFTAALNYIAEILRPETVAARRIAGIDIGVTERIDLANGAFALEQVYYTKTRPDGFFESHRKYIDVQVMVAGTELMEVEDVARLVVAESYNEERDFIKYTDTMAASRLRMRAGDVAVFFPADGHMPCLRFDDPVLVRKTVVKVPVDKK